MEERIEERVQQRPSGSRTEAANHTKVGYTGEMRVRVDHEKCTGHGRCYTLAPDVYESDDEGSCSIPNEEVETSKRDAARRAALNCPEDAIEILED